MSTAIPARQRARMLELAASRLEDVVADLKFHLVRGGPPPAFVARRCGVAVADVRRVILDEIARSEAEDVRIPQPEDDEVLR